MTNNTAAELDVDLLAERLAKHIAKEESYKANTLDGALLHQKNWRRILPEAYRAIEAMNFTSPWRDIKTAPKDGTEFQTWMGGEWEPRCRYNPKTGKLEIWGLIDYSNQEGWDPYLYAIATHWMPTPKEPS